MVLNLLFYLTFLLFSLGQLGRISFLDQQINIYLYEGLVLLVILILFTRHGLQAIKDSLKNFWAIHFFLLLLLVSFLIGVRNFKPFENLIGLLYFGRLVLYFIYFFYLFYQIKRRPKFARTVRMGLLIFIFLTAVTSILQYIFYPDLRNLLYAGWDPHLYRLFGTFFDTSLAGGVYGLIFLVLFFVETRHASSLATAIKNKLFFRCLLFIYLIFIALTYSRSSYVAFTIVFILHAVVKRWYKGLLIFFTSFLLVLVIVPKPFGEGVNLERTFSLKSRIEDYRTAIKIWKRKPFLGIGYNRIRYAKSQMNISGEVESNLTHSGASFHSSFLVILVSGGIIGLALFALLLTKLALLNEFTKYTILFLSISSLSDNIILHPFILFLFFSLISASIVIPSRR